jgi:hypothetical protein
MQTALFTFWKAPTNEPTRAILPTCWQRRSLRKEVQLCRFLTSSVFRQNCG